jgi:hypothetical protein
MCPAFAHAQGYDAQYHDSGPLRALRLTGTMCPSGQTRSGFGPIIQKEPNVKKIIILVTLALILCLSGCFGVPTAGRYPYNGTDMGALQTHYPDPDQSR